MKNSPSATSPFAPDADAAPDWETVDRRAWEAIVNWPRAVAFDPVRDGLDYSELTRWFLWDKVGRAVRKQLTPERFAIEIEELGWEKPPRGVLPHLPGVRTAWQRLGDLKYQAKIAWRHRRQRKAYRQHILERPAKTNQPLLFIPVPTERLLNTARTLLDYGDMQLYAPETQYRIDDVVRIPYPKGLPKPATGFAAQLHGAILEGLARQGIHLLEPDAETLKAEIDKQQIQLAAARAYLDDVTPDVMLLSADNHPTHQHYVLLGRLRGIPTMMLQHGLDCEHYYLDNAYATAIAVWGPNRKQRYEQHSDWQPERITVTGNPQYDGHRLAEVMNPGGEYWLWVTRPHTSAKCYAPSRSPWEAVEILEALLDALEANPGKQLLIKPHPRDAIPLLEDTLGKRGLGERAQIVDTPPMQLFPAASVVISEDSTAGMEAMLLGKPVVHAHFAPAPPTMAFVDYDAALPGFNPLELAESIVTAENLDEAAQKAMLAGQRRFIEDHAGPCDGKAAERVREFILEILK
ncbi:MAG: hypothetical protein ACLFTT_06305 [Candidatus Hydrogenedentota bacterium]